MLLSMHNHTTLCNHATGSMQEYVEEAIAQNISYFAFSDHAPMSFDPEYRMSVEQCDMYEKNVLALKEKYAKDIQILLAYEVDFMNDSPIKYFEPRVFNAKVDYLIGSVHFLSQWGFDNYEYVKEYKSKNIDDLWQEYFDAICALAKCGKFDVVGHLDLIKVFNFMPKKDIRLIAQEAIKQIKKHNLVVEINGSGLRKPVKEQYPSIDLLQMCYDNDIDITLSTDSHKIEHISSGLEEVHQMAKDIGYQRAVVFRDRQREYVNL